MTSTKDVQQHRPRQDSDSYVVVPMREGKLLGLELDFSEEGTARRGVRVSRVRPGLAYTLGVRQEDRLFSIGEEDIRDLSYVRIRDMLQQPRYPTELTIRRTSLSAVDSGRYSDANGHERRFENEGRAYIRQERSPRISAEADLLRRKPPSRKRPRNEQASRPTTVHVAPPSHPRAGGSHLLAQLEVLAAEQAGEEEESIEEESETTPLLRRNLNSARLEEAQEPGGCAPSPADHGSSPAPNDEARETLASPPREAERKNDIPEDQLCKEQNPRVSVSEVEDNREDYTLPLPTPVRRSHQSELDEGGGPEDNVVRTTAASSPAEHEKAPIRGPPPWLASLTSLTLAKVGGTDFAKAAIVTREVQEMLARELKALQRVQKEFASATVTDYTSFRSPGLEACRGLAMLKTLKERYLVDCELELAEIAETAIIPGLLGEETSPAASSREEEKPQSEMIFRKDTSASGKPRPVREQAVARRGTASAKQTMPRVEFVRDNHTAIQNLVREALTRQEQAFSMTGLHRQIRRQILMDVKDARAKGKHTGRQASIVVAKVRGWEKAARVSEAVAVKLTNDVIRRGEKLRDAVEFLMAGVEQHHSTVQCLASVQMLNGPAAAGWDKQQIE